MKLSCLDVTEVAGNEILPALSGAAFQAMSLGWDEDAYVEQVLDSPLADAVQDRDRSPNTLDELESLARSHGWGFAVDHYTPGTREGVTSWVEAMVPRVFAYRNWSKGPRGITERKAALAVLRVGAERGAWTFNISERFLSAEADIADRETARGALKKLVEIGFIRFQPDRSSRRYGNHYEINRSWMAWFGPTSVQITLSGLYYLGGSRAFLGSPVAEWVYYLLPESTPADAADVLGVSPSAAKRAYKRLVDDGLMQKIGKVYHRTEGLLEPDWTRRDELRARYALEQKQNREAVESGYKNREAAVMVDYEQLVAAQPWELKELPPDPFEPDPDPVLVRWVPSTTDPSEGYYETKDGGWEPRLGRDNRNYADIAPPYAIPAR